MNARLVEMHPEIPLDQVAVYAAGLDHPEGLAFDREGFLWAGSEAGEIYRIAPAGKVEVVARIDGFCCGMAFSPHNELFLCHAKLGVVKIERDGRYSVFADRAGSHQIACANFAAFDRAGNLWVTDSGQWQKRNGYLLRFTPEGQGQVAAGPFGYANGLALSADERQLYMVESDSGCIFRFDVHPGGALSPPQIFAEDVGRLPDGLAFDAAGQLYATCYASDDIYRIDTSGKKTLVAHDPYGLILGGPTNLAFGGPAFNEIFVANLSRYTIVQFRAGKRGQPLANTGTS